MGKIIITGVDGNFGGFTAKSIMKKVPLEQFIFMSPSKKALEQYQEKGIETRYGDFNDAEQLKDAFDPSTHYCRIYTDGEWAETAKAFPFCSEGMVSFGKAIRLDQMSYYTNDFEMLTGRKPLSVRQMFEDSDNHRIGNRTSID